MLCQQDPIWIRKKSSPIEISCKAEEILGSQRHWTSTLCSQSGNHLVAHQPMNSSHDLNDFADFMPNQLHLSAYTELSHGRSPAPTSKASFKQMQEKSKDCKSSGESEDLNKNTVTATAVKAQHHTKTASAETKSQKKSACQPERWEVSVDKLQKHIRGALLRILNTGSKAQE